MGGDAIPVIKKRRLSFCFYIIFIDMLGERIRGRRKFFEFLLWSFELWYHKTDCKYFED